MNYDLKTIICATDLSESGNKALPIAAYFAEKYHAKLIVTHVIDLPAVTPYAEPMRDPEEIKARVEETTQETMLAILADKPNINWELDVRIGFPAQEIVALAKESKAELVVAATHERTGIERLLLGSVSRKLMHALPCPFLIVPGALASSVRDNAFHRILIGCDFSPDSLRAVNWGLDFAQAFEAELHLATVIDPKEFKSLTRNSNVVPKDVMERMREDLINRLKALLPEEAHHWCHPQIAVLVGQPHEELNKYALMNDIDLIVMGIHGRGFIASILVGSTTDRLTRLGHCSIMAVREMDKEDK